MHELLSNEGIKPVIQNQALWKEDKERMLPGHDGNSNIVFDEAGTVYGYDRVSKPMIRHQMAYLGYEPAREVAKYRGPAAHEGWECPMMKICNAGRPYRKTVRVPRDVDLQRFPASPRATKKFERLLERTHGGGASQRAVESVLGSGRRNVIGSPRFYAHVGVVMGVRATPLRSAPVWFVPKLDAAFPAQFRRSAR